MGADSNFRRAVKRAAGRLLGAKGYAWLQAGAMAFDIRTGRLSEPELDLVVAVSPGDVAIDMGANFGLYTYALDRAVGPRGRVYAFEPVPFTCGVLRQVARLLRFRSVQILQEGCGEREEVISLTVPVQDSGGISAGQAHLSTRDDARPGAEAHVRWPRHTDVQCTLVAIDERVPASSDVAFIKADVEGAELFAFRGAAELIDRCHPTVVAEINPWFLAGFGQTVEALVGFFEERGYGLYRYDARTKRLVPERTDAVVEDNYVFVHPDRARSLKAFGLGPPAGG